jgi:hypothetical protein
VRPVLKPALRRLWRGDATLQLGADPAHACVLDGVDADAASVLALLDGTRDVDEVVTAAAATGLHADGVREFVGLLADVGVLSDAASAPRGLATAERERLEPDLATLDLLALDPVASARWADARRAASVLVIGAGRVGSLVAALLGAAGVGHVAVRDEQRARRADAVPGGLAPEDAGQPRAIATVEAAQRAGAVSVEGAVRPPDASDCHAADIAVVASDGWLVPDGALVELLGVVSLPYVLTGIRETYGVVGPLVLPGRTSCPRCHDLARTERDSDWPRLAAQLSVPARGGEPACDVTLAAAVAALTAGQVLAYLAEPDAARCVDATLEVRLPDWTVRRRTWTPHRDCPCDAVSAAEAAAVAARVAEIETALDVARTAATTTGATAGATAGATSVPASATSGADAGAGTAEAFR